MSKKGTSRNLKRAVIFIFILILSIAFSLFAKSYLIFSSLEVVEDEIQFVNDFKSEGKVTVDLKKCTDWSDLFYSWCVKSQLFPYKRLKITQIKQGVVRGVYERGKETNLSSESKWTLVDPLWKILYVGYSKYPESLKYFGPYRFGK